MLTNLSNNVSNFKFFSNIRVKSGCIYECNQIHMKHLRTDIQQRFLVSTTLEYMMTRMRMRHVIQKM